MAHWRVRYTKIPPPVGGVFISKWAIPRVTEVICARNALDAQKMLGQRDTSQPLTVTRTTQAVTAGRYCACRRIS